jgi:hypothetical protein
VNEISLEKIFEFNNVLSESFDCLTSPLLESVPEAYTLQYIINEVHDFISLHTKDRVLIAKLRIYFRQKKAIKKKLQLIKHYLDSSSHTISFFP